MKAILFFCAGLFFCSSAVADGNLFANPEFDQPDAVWKVGRKGRTERIETAPMSGEWIYRTTGESYLFLSGSPRSYEPDTEYTMEVKARGVKGKATLNVLELFLKPNGKVGEGVHVADKVLLDEEFRTYRFPFVSSKHPLFSFAFYKWDPRTGDGGIDIASIRLYKGRLPTLEFRPLNRVGRKTPVEGTSVPLPVNAYGRRRDRLLALAMVNRDRDIREIQEFFNGLNVEVDVLSTTGKDQDIYETDTPRKLVEWRLAKSEYKLFVVPSRAAARIGESLYAAITNGVHSGAGLYMLNTPHPGRFESILALSLPKTPSGDALSRAFPYGILNPKDVDFNPANLAEGKFGKGRVIVEKAPRTGILKLCLRHSVSGTVMFPFGGFADPYLARIMYRAAGMDGFDEQDVNNVEWSAVDVSGTIRRSGVSRDQNAALMAAQSAFTTSGRHFVSFWKKDKAGNVLDYDASSFERTGPRISAFVPVVESVSGDGCAVFTVETNDASDCALVWTLEDFSGRVIEIGRVESGSRFEVPVRRLYTNMGFVKLQLRQKGMVRDVRVAPVYARDKDRERTNGDFTPSIWGAMYSLSRDTFNQFDRHLEDVGFRASVLPVPQGGFAQTLRNGMAVGGNDLGEGSVFRPFGQKGNVRIGGINTKRGRDKMCRYASATAKRAAPYGVTQYVVTDEPNFTLRRTSDELDEHPENIAEYRRRMAEKYGSIARFNARHGTSYSSFDELSPARIAEARSTGKFAEFIEWRNFNADRWCEAIGLICDEAKKQDPTARVSLANSFGQTALSANDYWKLLTKTGLDFSNEYTAMVYFGRDAIYNFDEFYRSFRPDMRLWGYVGYGMSKTQVCFMPWWFAAHRYGGFTWFSACGRDFRIFEQPSLAYTQDAADLKSALESSRLMDGLGKLFLSSHWAKRDIAIYYSHESLLVATLLGKETSSFEILDTGPLHDYMYSRQGAQYIVEDLLYQFDFVSPEQVSAGVLDGKKVLMMPRIKALSDGEIAALSRFVKAGGRIVADELPGEYDELGNRRKAPPFSAKEVYVTGANFDDLNVTQRAEMLDVLIKANAKPVLTCNEIVSKTGRESMRFVAGTADVFVLLRMPGRSKGVEKDIFELPIKGYVYDSVAGRYLGHSKQIEVEWGEGGAAVYSVLKSKPSSLRVEGVPEAIKRGEELKISVALETAGVAPDTVFNVRFVSPSGECRFHMQRNVDASKGMAKIVFPMAYNDVAGDWRVVVTEAMTGMSVERKFSLR